jgi:tetratricopeptide (TPR) repeat protein
MSPQRQKKRTLAMLVDQLAGLAARRPVLVVWEDVHWNDPTSRELLDLIIDRAQSLRALVVITFRPEFAAPWTRHGHVTALTLARLGRRLAAAIVDGLTGGKALPDSVLNPILAKTDGVPLFVEELTKAVLEAGLLEDEGDRYALNGPLPALAIPDTLHDSLMARLDRLAPVKEIAQIGAAIGREFSYELLAAVAPVNEDELREALAQLCNSQLVFSRGAPPEATYTFKHALVRDTAYATLLRGRRQQLHARIAKGLEELFPETAASTPELLAHHWAEAGSTMRAIELWTAAGERALARAANREASGFFERALVALGRLDQTPDLLARTIDLHYYQYGARYRFGELHGARANLFEAERLAVGLNESTRLVRILAQQTYILASIGDVAGALRTGERAVALADCGEDLDGRAGSHTMLARAMYAKGWYREAISHLHEAIKMIGEDVLREFGVGMNQAVSARVWLLLCCAELGQFAEAAAEASVAEQLLAQIEDGRQQEERVWLRLAVGRLAVLQGDFTKAVETLEPVLLPCESEFAIYFSRVASSLGIAHARSGRVAKGVALLRQAVSRDQAIDFHFRFGLLLAQLGEVLLLAHDIDGALEAGTRALKAARTSGEEASEAWALWLLGDVAAQLHRSEAAAHNREALEMSGRLGMAPLRARCLESMGRLV